MNRKSCVYPIGIRGQGAGSIFRVMAPPCRLQEVPYPEVGPVDFRLTVDTFLGKLINGRTNRNVFCVSVSVV